MRMPRRQLRLQRYRKIRRQIHQRFSRRIFERDRKIKTSSHPIPQLF